MDQDHFDDINWVVASKRFSRGQVLKTLGAGLLLSGSLEALWPPSASAKKKHRLKHHSSAAPVLSGQGPDTEQGPDQGPAPNGPQPDEPQAGELSAQNRTLNVLPVTQTAQLPADKLAARRLGLTSDPKYLTCARACVVMVLRYYGYKISMDDSRLPDILPVNAHIRYHVAPSFPKLTNFKVSGYNFGSSLVNSSTWLNFIRSETNAGRPVIALIPNGRNVGHPDFTAAHYVVVRGLYPDGSVGWVDPYPTNGGYKVGSQSYFANAWESATGSSGTYGWQGVYTR